jgi:ABC-type branched-subunit amino acid transport system substrate-binding protein
MTGQYAAFGEQLRKGAEMAVADINAAGGVNGQKLELQIGDDACDPKQATAVANKMVADKVGSSPATTAPAARSRRRTSTRKAKILQITPASTNIKLTDDAFAKGNTTVFRTCGRDDVQGATVGAYILKHTRTRRSRSSRQVALRQRRRRRDQEGAEQGRPARGDVRVLQRHRQGLHRADQQDEAGARSTSSCSAATTPRARC